MKKGSLGTLLITIFIVIIIIIIIIIILRPNCTKEGNLFLNNKKPCCSGLTPKSVHINFVTIEGKCYDFIDMYSMDLNKFCIACGDGKCSKLENKCNCEKDCSNQPSDYESIEKFCSSQDYSKYCEETNQYSGKACELCQN